MTSIASVASDASPTTVKLEPRSARTPDRQMGWSSASTTRTARRSLTVPACPMTGRPTVREAPPSPRDPQAHLGAVARVPVDLRATPDLRHPGRERALQADALRDRRAASKPGPSSLTEQRTPPATSSGPT
jgi:hypothetical protein